MNIENHMVIGAGPYDNEVESNYSVYEIIDELKDMICSIDIDTGHESLRIDVYNISFDYRYDEDDERFIVLNLKCMEGKYEALTDEHEKLLTEKIEDILESLYLSMQTQKSRNTNKSLQLKRA